MFTDVDFLFSSPLLGGRIIIVPSPSLTTSRFATFLCRSHFSQSRLERKREGVLWEGSNSSSELPGDKALGGSSLKIQIQIP